MHGCCGHMGQVISQIVKEDADAQIVAGIDPFDNGKMEYPVYKSLEDCKEEADVVIDFASAKAEDALLDYCGAHKLPVVVCTTGLSEEQLQKVAETAKKTAGLTFLSQRRRFHYCPLLSALYAVTISVTSSAYCQISFAG